MDRKSLMIGDFVNLCHRGLTLKVIGIDARKNTVLVEAQDNFKLQIPYDEEEINPIPLTEEILKANGFKESSIECGCYYFPEKYQELNDRGFAVETDDEGRFWITDHQLMMTRYVHTFQHALRLCGLNGLADNFKGK